MGESVDETREAYVIIVALEVFYKHLPYTSNTFLPTSEGVTCCGSCLSSKCVLDKCSQQKCQQVRSI